MGSTDTCVYHRISKYRCSVTLKTRQYHIASVSIHIIYQHTEGGRESGRERERERQSGRGRERQKKKLFAYSWWSWCSFESAFMCVIPHPTSMAFIASLNHSTYRCFGPKHDLSFHVRVSPRWTIACTIISNIMAISPKFTHICTQSKNAYGSQPIQTINVKKVTFIIILGRIW